MSKLYIYSGMLAGAVARRTFYTEEAANKISTKLGGEEMMSFLQKEDCILLLLLPRPSVVIPKESFEII